MFDVRQREMCSAPVTPISFPVALIGNTHQSTKTHLQGRDEGVLCLM